MDNEFELIEDINLALNCIKNKKILCGINGHDKVFFAQNKEKIIVINKNSSFYLEYELFLDLYKDFKFYIYNPCEESYDFSRDDEYYSWKHK